MIQVGPTLYNVSLLISTAIFWVTVFFLVRQSKLHGYALITVVSYSPKLVVVWGRGLTLIPSPSSSMSFGKGICLIWGIFLHSPTFNNCVVLIWLCPCGRESDNCPVQIPSHTQPGRVRHNSNTCITPPFKQLLCSMYTVSNRMCRNWGCVT